MEELKSIEASVKSATESVEKMKAANEAAIADVKTQVAEVKAAVVTMDEAAKKNQAALDQMIAEKAAKTVNNKNKSFGDAFSEQIAEAFDSKQAEINEFQRNKNAKLTIDLKAVGTMTTSANLSGDGVATYNTRQGLVPAQKVNFRDLIPTAVSPTGLYVTYRETGTEGSIGIQTEGNLKFLQLGVFTSDATVWLCNNVLTDKSSKLIDVDNSTDVVSESATLTR